MEWLLIITAFIALLGLCILGVQKMKKILKQAQMDFENAEHLNMENQNNLTNDK